jgi:hypothetical protein
MATYDELRLGDLVQEERSGAYGVVLHIGRWLGSEINNLSDAKENAVWALWEDYPGKAKTAYLEADPEELLPYGGGEHGRGKASFMHFGPSFKVLSSLEPRTSQRCGECNGPLTTTLSKERGVCERCFGGRRFHPDIESGERPYHRAYVGKFAAPSSPFGVFAGFAIMLSPLVYFLLKK